MWNDIVSVLEALDIFAFIGVIVTIYFATRRKSYEILIRQRLDTLVKTREDMSRLLYLFSVEGIAEYKTENDSAQAYNAEVRKLTCSLRMQIKPLYVPEIKLCDMLDTTWRCAQNYFSEPNGESEKILIAANAELLKEYDVYDWTVWLYCQELHKTHKDEMQFFDDIYFKVKQQKTIAEERIKK